MSNFEAAFFIGLFGSVHCIGMCGPLAMAVPFRGASRWLLFRHKLLYQLGRITSYTALGIAAGLIGRQLWLLNIQNGISIASGILIIMAALSRMLKLRRAGGSTGGLWFGPVNRLLTRALKNRAGHLYIGMLNGLLPCGFVYLALIGAINTGGIATSAGFMLFFGLGTLPLMYAATLGSGFFTIQVRNRLNKIVPYFMLFLGLWFIMRGMPFNIPYISPAIHTIAPAACGAN